MNGTLAKASAKRAPPGTSKIGLLKSEFVALVSHELRAPLTALNGGLEVALQTADTLPPQARRILEAMVDESRRLTQLVQSILDVSRLEAGRLTLNLGPVAVAPLLHRAAEVIIGDRRPIRWHLPAQIPPVWADEVYYEQIIRNLLRNADKYSPAGQPVEVHVTVEEAGVRVEIVDHGPGIAPAVQAVMFERFTRGQTGENAPAGWGLGLYFARKLTEAQGGRLTVRSPAWPAPDVPGAAFAVTFPLAAEAPEELEDG
ncbi:MAG: sensor histidine kinase [Anaerolineae bacterium]